MSDTNPHKRRRPDPRDDSDSDSEEGPPTPARPAPMNYTAPGPDDEPQLQPAPAPMEYDDEPLTEPEDLEDLDMAPPEVPQGPGLSQVQTRGKKAAGGVPDGNNAASSVSGDETVGSAATNFTDASQASIASIASSVDQLPLPDAELMLFEVAEGVNRLTTDGMAYFNMVAERAGGYGPIASIAFISLLTANPNLLPNMPTIDLSGIASQIGLTPFVAQEAVAASAPGLFGFASNVTSSITSGIMAGVTAIVAAIGTNQVVANPVTIDNIAGMVESVGNTAIGAVITVAEFQRRMMVVLKKLKANWTVKNLQVEGISTLQKDNINNLVNRALTTHAHILDPNDNGEQPLTEEQLRNAYNGIVNDINNVASTEHVPVIAEGDNVDGIRDEAANDLIENAAPAPPAAGAGRNTGGGKKNRKTQKKPRKRVTKSKRGKKAARKTKKQSRRKSRGKKHGKKH